MAIPKIISEYAKQIGFNSITHLKTIGKSEYYSFGLVDKDGNAQPTGLPFVVEYKNDNIFRVPEDVMWDLLP